jgi:hypothetical protein
VQSVLTDWLVAPSNASAKPGATDALTNESDAPGIGTEVVAGLADASTNDEPGFGRKAALMH